jgi:anti-sigma regulatory factor (Ser/Thr protein kinase)
MGSDTDAGYSHRPEGEVSHRAAMPIATTANALRWRQVFRGEERQLGAMRRWLKSLLPDCAARDDLLSVATELANNAIQHTASGRGASFAVEVAWHQSVVQVAVADRGGPGEPRVIDDPDGERGRGLLLVQALSIRTGFAGDQRGRLVWAQIPWEDPSGAAPVSSQDPYQVAIRDGEAALARRFAGVPAWFGRATLRWWALPDSGDLVSAPSAAELAALLYRLQETARSPRAGSTGQPHHAADENPGLALAREPGPSRRAEPGTRRPGSSAADRPDGRGRQRNPRRPPPGIPRPAWVLSCGSRLTPAPAALTSGVA